MVILWLTQSICSSNESVLLPGTNYSSSNSSHLILTTNSSKEVKDGISDRSESVSHYNSSTLSSSALSLSPHPPAVTTGPYLTPVEIFGNRILIMALSFDVTHSDAMNELLSEYLSMCEGGWNVTGANFEEYYMKHILLEILISFPPYSVVVHKRRMGP